MRQYNKERYVFIPFHLFIYWLSRNDCFIGIAIFMYVYLAPDQRHKKLPIYRRSASVVGPGDTPASLSVFTAAMTRMFMQAFCYRTHTHTHKSYVQICETTTTMRTDPKTNLHHSQIVREWHTWQNRDCLSYYSSDVLPIISSPKHSNIFVYVQADPSGLKNGARYMIKRPRISFTRDVLFSVNNYYLRNLKLIMSTIVKPLYFIKSHLELLNYL